MILSADVDSPRSGLLLEVAFQTQHMIPLSQHSRVHRAVWAMTGRAAFAHRLVFEHERASLRDVAFAASLLFRREGSASSDDGLSFMRVVAIGATDPLPHRHRLAMGAFKHRMCVRQTELGPLIEMALKTDLGRATRIDDRVMTPARLDMFTSGAVARFAPDIHRVRPFGLESGMCGGVEPLCNLFMALLAALRSGKCCSFNLRRRDHRSCERRAGNCYCSRYSSDQTDHQRDAVLANPSFEIPFFRQVSSRFHDQFVWPREPSAIGRKAV